MYLYTLNKTGSGCIITSQEIIKNRTWLIKIAQQLMIVEGVDNDKNAKKAERDGLNRQIAKRAAESTILPDTVHLYTV